MKTKRRSEPRFAFPAVIIFSLCLPTSANHTDYLSATQQTWSPISHNLSGRQNTTTASTNPALSIGFGSRTSTVEAQTRSLQPPRAQRPTPAPGARNCSEHKGPVPTEPCQDNKALLLICFIIIAVLVLICTFLLLSTVVIANKMSHLKKAVQGKRRPRSNVDILATSSLWPTAAGTWQRLPRETPGAELLMQDRTAGAAAIQRRSEDPTSETLTKETDNEQENRNPKPHKPILTNLVVEI